MSGREPTDFERRVWLRAWIHAVGKCPPGCRCVDAFEQMGADRAALAGLIDEALFDAVMEKLLAVSQHTQRYALATHIFGREAVAALQAGQARRGARAVPNHEEVARAEDHQA